MRALRFDRTGSLDDLALVEMDPPVAGPDDVVVEVRAAAVNPSDVKNVLGRFASTRPPRIPGRDFGGVVVEGPAELRGRRVCGSGGGGLGFGRDGAHAERVAAPRALLVELPGNMEFAVGAALGVPVITASLALEAVAPRAGETVLVVGASGAVGAWAARLAHAAGARVLGTRRRAGGDAPVDWIGLPAVDDAAAAGRALEDSVAQLTVGRGVDAIVDTVGGALFPHTLRCLAPDGRIAALASTPPEVRFDLVDFYRRRATLHGIDSVATSAADSARLLAPVVAAIAAGALPVPAFETRRFEEFARAYADVQAGWPHKIVLVP